MSQYGKNRQAIRRTEFKKTIQGDDGRKKREDNTVQIRKEKRIESFQKRRNLNLENSFDALVVRYSISCFLLHCSLYLD